MIDVSFLLIGGSYRRKRDHGIDWYSKVGFFPTDDIFLQTLEISLSNSVHNFSAICCRLDSFLKWLEWIFDKDCL